MNGGDEGEIVGAELFDGALIGGVGIEMKLGDGVDGGSGVG